MYLLRSLMSRVVLVGRDPRNAPRQVSIPPPPLPMYANVVTARQRMSGIDRFDLPEFALPPACLTSRPLAGKGLCKIFLVRPEGGRICGGINMLERSINP